MKKFLAVVLTSAMALSLEACGGGSSTSTESAAASGSSSGSSTATAADGQVYEFSLSMHDPVTTSNAIYMQEWIDKVSEATDGHVKITLYGSATLSAATDIADNVANGAVDIGWLYTSYYAGQFPLSDVINLPFQGFGDPIVSTNVLWDLYENNTELEEEWGDYKLLMLYGNPGMILCSKDKPLTSVADLKGLSIRCPSGAITDVLLKWGANPITMSPPDIYEALEKNNISGYIFEPSGITNFSLQEQTTYYTDYQMYDGPFALIMNWDQWNSLPTEYQEAIDAISGKDASLGAAESFADAVEVARETITASGGQFVEIPEENLAEFQEAADEYASEWTEMYTTDSFDAAAYLANAKELAASYAE